MINKQEQRIEQLERVLFLQQGKIEQLKLRLSYHQETLTQLKAKADDSEAKNV